MPAGLRTGGDTVGGNGMGHGIRMVVGRDKITKKKLKKLTVS